MSDSPQKIRPFSNASEFESWLGNNCFKCSKYNPDSYPTCEIDEAILLASAGEDTITYAIALRMGADTDLSYGWQWRQLCTEFKPVLNYYAIAVWAA